MSAYTKEFEVYYSFIAGIEHLEMWQRSRFKRALFNAFKKGKQLGRQEPMYAPRRSYMR
jgi:hypothetical protein